jgi:hypothetical protein
MSTVGIRELCFLLIFLLQHATIVQSTADTGDELETTMTGAASLLRGSALSASSIQHMERIVDMDAIAALNGVDPASSQFVFHPPGHEANFWDYPFFAHWTHAECGATVIHDDILLTAGHVSALQSILLLWGCEFN